MRGGRRGALAALWLQVFLAAATYLAAKRTLVEIEPWTTATMRFAIAAAAFLALLGLQGWRRPPREDLRRIALLGILAVPLNQLFFLEGLARSSASHAALIYALTPIGVRVIDHLRGTRTTPLELLGLVSALAGTVLVLLARTGGAFSPEPLLGDAFLLVAMVSWVLYTVLSKPLVERHGALRVSGWTILAGTAVTLPFGASTLLRAPYASFSGLAWFGVLYLALVTSVACYALWGFALGRLRATQVAVFSNLQPPVAALLSWLVLGERISLSLAAGGLLVVGGVLLTQLERRAPGAQPLEEPGRVPIG
ncbi:MAG: EamA family transporter [Planctomycetes bacterium]|nr:EamA family transporter [Planctomycetota bacterium]